MQFTNPVDIKQSDTISFDVMYISGRYTIKLVEYFVQVFLSDADALIFDFKAGLVIDPFESDMDYRSFLTVFNGVVKQIGQYIAQMKTISLDAIVIR